jgi:hypothetical protein
LWLRPRNVLAAFCVALFVFGLTRTGRSTESVDVRTYVEMTRSIALHGLPYFDNGPVEQFTALRSPFNLWTHGHLWGIYGPVYPYFAALPFKVGGLVLASIATCLLLIPLALVTFFLTRRLLAREGGDGARTTHDEWYAVAAAILVVIATPALGKSLELSGYPLAMLLVLAATATAVEAITSRGRRRYVYAIATGALGAAGSGTHLLCLPMSLALFGALALCDASSDERRGPAWLDRTVLHGLWPTRETIGSAVAATVTLIILTVPIAFLNHVRFGSYNPFSYGPVPWSGMQYLGAEDQTISAHVKAAAPVIVLVGWLAVGWLVGGSVRPRWTVRGITLGLAAVALVASPMLRDKAWIYTKALYAFTIDQSMVDLPLPYTRAPHTFGNMHGPWVTKSPIQCTPILLLALFLPRTTSRAKQKLLTVLAPCLALFAYLTLRGNLPLYSALGVPWAYIRYTMPALPMLVAGVMVVARDVELRRRDWLIAAAVGANLAAVFWLSWGDFPLYRQILALALPVGIAVLSVIGVVLFRHGKMGRSVVAAIMAVACGVSIGVGVGWIVGDELARARERDGEVTGERVLEAHGPVERVGVRPG